MATTTGRATGKSYVIGKGKLYFAPFTPGTKTIAVAERYLGNSPELSSTISQDTLDHIDADQGLNVKDDQVTIQNDLTGAFKLDSIEPDNVAMWFGGDIENATIMAATAIIDPDQVGKKGRWYQLGTSDINPSGARKVVNVIVSSVVPAVIITDPPVVTVIPALNNFEFDLVRGRVYIEADAPGVTDGTMLRFKYDQEATTRETIIAKGDEVRGAMRFIAHNPHGADKDYFWPYVKVTSNGDYALKGDSWQEMTFNYEVLKRDDTVERLYIDGVPQ